MNKHPENILPDDGEVYMYPDFFTEHESDGLFHQLIQHTPWKQDYLRIYGKEIRFPRLTAWYGDEGNSYTYSGIRNTPLPWTEVLLDIKQYTEDITGHSFNAALLNLYRNEKDSMGWHSDDEPELGMNPVIASLSLGSSRRFHFKHKTLALKSSVILTNGSLLLMKGATQHHWLHQLPKSSRATGPRINVTFRTILP